MIFDNLFRLCSCRNEVHHSDEDYLLHEQELNRNLSNANVQRVQVKGDGNCLFYALAQGLIYEMKKDANYFGRQLQTFGLSADLPLTSFAKRLRQICVEQWKLNEDFYSQFLSTENISFTKELRRFSKTGVSDSILGDVVPLTIANTFNIDILIITSLANLAQIEVKPSQQSSSTYRKVIYLAYNQYDLGHYDAAYHRN